MSDEKIERLRRNDTTLKYLRVYCSDEIDIKAIADALKGNTALADLDLSGNDIFRPDLPDLRESFINDDGAKALADALKENSALTSLKMGKNDIGAEGARALADALEKNSTLTSLELDHNKIGPEGARALADALKTNNTLTCLALGDAQASPAFDEVGGNEIGPEGAKALADGLKENAALTTLFLDWNKIGVEGAMALADALETNTTLTELTNQTSRYFPDKAVVAHIKDLETRNKLKLLDWKIAVIAKADAQKRLTEEEKKIWEAEKVERKRKAEEEEEKQQKFIEKVINKMEVDLKKKAKVEADQAKRADVPVIAPTECEIMISFNDDSSGEDAELLTKYLTQNGYPTFCTRLYCPENSGSWREATIKGVRHCKYYIMLMSNGWQKSNECQFETKIAINRFASKKNIPIPVWYDDFNYDFDEVGDGYYDTFQSVQSVQRKSSSWMKTILKQLGGSNAEISLENYDDEANDEHERIPNSSDFWTHAAVTVAIAVVSFAIGSSRRKS